MNVVAQNKEAWSRLCNVQPLNIACTMYIRMPFKCPYISTLRLIKEQFPSILHFLLPPLLHPSFHPPSLSPSLTHSLSLAQSPTHFPFNPPSPEEENKDAWVYAENIEDDDYVLDSTGNLPLYVDHYRLTNMSESLTVSNT